MKLTTRSEYALLALTHLARSKSGAFLPAGEIAQAQKIPHKYLEQILLLLKGSRLLKSRKGQRGGYRLAKPAQDISLAEVIRLMDGPLAATESVSRYFYEPTPIESEKKLLKVFKELRDQVSDKLERTKLVHIAALLFGLILPAVSARAQDVQNLDQRVKILERKLELQEEKENAAAAQKKEPGAITLDKNGGGFWLKTADDTLKMHLGGHLQEDSRWYLNQQAHVFNDTFLLRRARISLDGTLYDWVDFRFLPDFGLGTSLIQDAYIDLRFMKEASLRFGKFKEPFGLEQLQPDPWTAFVERGLPSDISPNRDTGIELHGEIFDGVVKYGGGIFNGVADGASTPDLDTDRTKDGAGRVFLQPFKPTQWTLLQDFGAGVGFSGTSGAGALASYKTTSQQTFFSYAAASVPNGHRFRFSPQAYWYPGPFGLLFEHVTVWQDVRNGTAQNDLRNRAWQVYGTWALTGEKESYNGLRPAHPYAPGKGGTGAWELAARYGELYVDPATFPTFASRATQSRGVSSMTGGVNWYPNNVLKLMVDFEHSSLWGGSRSLENAVLTRVQLYF